MWEPTVRIEDLRLVPQQPAHVQSIQWYIYKRSTLYSQILKVEVLICDPATWQTSQTCYSKHDLMYARHLEGGLDPVDMFSTSSLTKWCSPSPGNRSLRQLNKQDMATWQGEVIMYWPRYAYAPRKSRYNGEHPHCFFQHRINIQ